MSARRITLHNDRLQSLGCGIHRRGQAGRSSANDCQVAQDFGFILFRERPQQTGFPGDLAQRRPAQSTTGRGYENRQITSCQIETFTQRLPLFTLKFYQPMRNAILVEKVIELMSIARIAACQNTHPRKYAIAPKPSPAHD